MVTDPGAHAGTVCLAAPAFDPDSVVSGVRAEVRAFYFVEKHSYLFDEYIRVIDVQLQQPVPSCACHGCLAESGVTGTKKRAEAR